MNRHEAMITMKTVHLYNPLINPNVFHTSNASSLITWTEAAYHFSSKLYNVQPQAWSSLPLILTSFNTSMPKENSCCMHYNYCFRLLLTVTGSSCLIQSAALYDENTDNFQQFIASVTIQPGKSVKPCLLDFVKMNNFTPLTFQSQNI
jgi:hypothetical protein